MYTKAIFLSQLASTLFMVGLIWVIQIVHYPLFASIASADFPEYERRHVRAISWVVLPVMLVELLSTLLLAWVWPLHRNAQFAGVGLLAVVWASTFALQVPCHNRLGGQFDRKTINRLVATNWIRTIAWTARGAVLIWITAVQFVV